MLVVILLAVAAFLFYKYYVSTYSLWKKRGAPSIPGKFPFGSDLRLTFMLKFDGDLHQEYYQRFSSSSYYGTYMMRLPTLLIKDPEIIEMILTKEFSHFRNRQFIRLHKNNVLSQNLFNLDGEKWRTLRVKLSPTFTSGKMKMMFQHFINCSEVLDKLLKGEVGSSIDIREIASRYSTDVICSCAFGIDSNTIMNPDNEFRQLGKKLFKINFNLLLFIKFMIITAFPEFSYLFSLDFFGKEMEEYLTKTINSIVEYREKNNERRNDFLDLLIQMKNKGTVGDDMKDEIDEQISEPIEMTNEMMAAQCFVFFFAGFETSSGVQTFCLYELALNPDIQARLQKEIDQVVEKHGALTYQAVKEMSYLDKVIKETMRKYPTLVTLTRVCTKPLTLPDGFRFEKGDLIGIPVWPLHRDPQYFPMPEKFDPERFSEENSHLIKPYTYLPFGEGPRMCIGTRFGLLQTKIGIITMIRNYSVQPSEKTEIPLVFSKPGPILRTKNPVILKLVSRNKT